MYIYIYVIIIHADMGKQYTIANYIQPMHIYTQHSKYVCRRDIYAWLGGVCVYVIRADYMCVGNTYMIVACSCMYTLLAYVCMCGDAILEVQNSRAGMYLQLHISSRTGMYKEIHISSQGWYVFTGTYFERSWYVVYACGLCILQIHISS